ncbi:MAG: NAD-dependent epimerase/dehydratase family protein [Promethearchaeota archaeon]|jgi:UDP-glucose 4-epimerase
MKILITGGKGFIGSKIIDTLISFDHDITVYDIAAKNQIQEDVNYVKGDIFDIELLSKSLKECDLVIHMVGQPNAHKAQEFPQNSFDLNVRSVQTVLESMRMANIDKLILPSSAAIYGTVKGSGSISEDTIPNPVNIYAFHKWLSEEICRGYTKYYGMNSIILRLFNVYGAQGTGIINILTKKAKKKETIVLYGEQQLRDFIHVDDVALAFAKVMECEKCKNQTINVGTGVGRSINEIVELVQRFISDISIERKEFTGEPYDSFANIDKLKNLVGFEPDNSVKRLENTIKEMI